MSYRTIAKCNIDPEFVDRLTACVAAEGAADPEVTADGLRWKAVTAADIEAAYESALAADHPSPGGDEAVISDQMILSVVQANLP